METISIINICPQYLFNIYVGVLAGALSVSLMVVLILVFIVAILIAKMRKRSKFLRHFDKIINKFVII